MPEKKETKSSPETRGHEHQWTIDAPREAVWKAITEAAELVNWFPLQAEVAPGTGGTITYDWGSGVVGRCRIEAWKSPHHLRTTWMEPVLAASGQENHPATVVDWHLEGAGGTTVLRLVHSGFGRDADWDTEYDGTRRGWGFELFSLKHYLERHAGTARRAFWIRQPAKEIPARLWSRFAEPGGLFREGRAAALAAGEPFRFVLPSGESLAGVTRRSQPPLDFDGTLTSHNDGLFRFGIEDFGRGPEAQIWISTWGLAPDGAECLERSCRDAMRQAFE